MTAKQEVITIMKHTEHIRRIKNAFLAEAKKWNMEDDTMKISELLEEVREAVHTFLNGWSDINRINELTPEIEAVTAKYPNNANVIEMNELVAEARELHRHIENGYFDDWDFSELLVTA
jgi:hypothetical protein